MADDRSKTGGQDRSRANTEERYELDYWSQKFGVSVEQLKAAVAAMSSQADAVEKYLHGAR